MVQFTVKTRSLMRLLLIARSEGGQCAVVPRLAPSFAHNCSESLDLVQCADHEFFVLVDLPFSRKT